MYRVVRRSLSFTVSRRSALHDVIGIAIGIVLPLLAATLYRTYSIAVTPNWLELTRQMGLPFVAGEIAVFIWARRAGFDPAVLFGELPRFARWALLLFTGTFWISSLLISRNPSFSMALTLIWIVHLLFAGATYHLARGRTAFDVARFAAWMSIGLALLVAWTGVHFLLPPEGLVVEWGLRGWGAAVPGFISHRLFGAWAGGIAVLLLGLLWQTSSGDATRWWLLPTFMLAVAAAAWTGTRGAVLGLAIGGLAGMLMIGRPAARAFFWTVPATIVLGAVIGMALTPYGDPAFMFFRPGTYGTVNEASSGRLAYWLAALRVVGEHPWVGSGAGSCWWLVSDNGLRHVQPHNAVIQFLLSWGIVPTTALIGLLGWATWRVHHIARAVPAIVPLVMMLDALLAMSMVDGMLYFARFLMLVSALYAICLASARDREAPDGRAPSGKAA